MSDAPNAPTPVASAAAPAAAEPVAAPPPATPKPSRASEALKAIEAARAEAKAKREAAAKPAAPGAPAEPAVDPDALAWRAHVKAESARIAAEAEGLDPEDKALIDGEKDITRKAALLARFKREAAAAPVKAAKVVAPAKPAGGPPSSSAIDFASALKDPKAMADAKERDPAGFGKFLSGLLTGSPRKSTLG